jgi:hypothetical protein
MVASVTAVLSRFKTAWATQLQPEAIPRSRWLKALGLHDQLVAWLKPKTCPSWLARET